jgi:Cu+-exporting ATPase
LSRKTTGRNQLTIIVESSHERRTAMSGEHHCSHHQSSEAVELKDPVCGMTVTKDSSHQYSYKGETYYFCSGRCRERFSAEPEKFLNKSDEPAASQDQNAWYICPMHPEVRQKGPGSCPKCGMALEPEAPSLEEEENPELTDFKRRFWWGLPFTLAVFVLAMFGHGLPGFQSCFGVTARTGSS